MPTDFEAIGIGERTRWSLGRISIEGEFVPASYAEGPPLPCWPSWGEWARCYGLCRDAFLAWYAIRHPDQTPGAELLFAAYQRGENPGAIMIDRGPDPRLALQGNYLDGSV